MAKTKMRCPFNDKLCIECQLYRGRHYFLCACKDYRGYIKPKDDEFTFGGRTPIDFESVNKLLEPWSDNTNNSHSYPDVKLKVIDMEGGEERYTSFAEAKTWNWGDTGTMRIVNGVHITSFRKFLEIARYQAEKGDKEITVLEAARFILLGGG